MEDGRKKRNPSHFKPGQSGNPKGKPPMSPEEKTLKQLNQIQLTRHLNAILAMDEQEVRDLFENKTEHTDMKTYLNSVFAAVLIKAKESGNFAQVSMLLDRSIGPVKQAVEHSGKMSLVDIVLHSVKPPEPNDE